MLKAMILTDEKTIYEGHAYMVSLPGEDGDFSVMAFHAPILSRLRSGVIDIYLDEKVQKKISVQTGLASMLGNQLTVIVQRKQ